MAVLQGEFILPHSQDGCITTMHSPMHVDHAIQGTDMWRHLGASLGAE
eukprot:CAMPEP_0178389964 /NCGR_PEP_ID=MMETSP0689_2-20121128/10399_1 /TAXON_ID=160604 /ORGANISM="Amphidinium massartii, Strain CS-259" /LENGTH=47 /DNA_ID= /DNA_START= /DNA_END= /DNA_ORIENTATION=